MATLLFIALVVAAVGSLGAPLIAAVAQDYRVSLTAAQWTLTISLLCGAGGIPLLGPAGVAVHCVCRELEHSNIAVDGRMQP